MGPIAVGILLSASTIALVAVARRTYVLAPTLVALGLQIGLSLGFFARFGLVGDAALYQRAGTTLANAWRFGTTPDLTLTDGKQSIAWVVAVPQWMGVSSPVAPLLALAILTATLPILLALATSKFGFPEASRVAAWLAAVTPEIVAWSPWMRRESLAFVILAFALISMALVFSCRYEYGLILSALTFALGSVTRPALNLVLICGVMTAAFVGFLQNRRQLLRHSGISLRWTLTVAFIGVLAAAWTLDSTYISEPLDSQLWTVIVRSNSSDGQSLGVSYDYASSSPALRVLSLASRPLNVMFGPFPWTWERPEWVVAGLDGLAMLSVVGLVVYLACQSPESRSLIVILCAACAPLVAGETFLHANYGITMRVRAHLILLLLPAIATGVQRVWAKLTAPTTAR